MTSNYPTDLTDSQWQIIEKQINDQRKRKYNLREIWNAMMYIIKSGCQWRMLPKDFPKWQLVYYYFRKWEAEGLIEYIHEELRKQVRRKHGKQDSPSLGLLDSQSVKVSSMTKEKGIDGNKKINGRKRHILTDTLGLVMSLVVHNANINDRQAGKQVLEKAKHKFARLTKVLADQGYTGDFLDWVSIKCNWVLEIVHKVVGEGGFQVLPKRWIVERTFGWFNFQRRLAKDYETLIPCSEAMVQMAMIRLMLNKLKK